MERTLAALVTALLGLGCATGIFGDGPSKSREDAIADCTQKVPAETVPYADAFAECMERHGWVYRSNAPSGS
jgi:hypothetical protein